jgi:MFS family permease
MYAFVLIWRLWGLQSNPAVPQQEPSSAFKTLRSLPFLLLAITFCAFCAMLWLIYAWLPTIVHEQYHLNLAHSGVTSTLSLQIGSALGVLIGGVLGDWAVTTTFTSRLEVALAGVVVCSPFAFAIFETHSLLLLQVATFCFGLASGVFIANTFSCLYDFADRNNLSFATGCLNTLGGAGAGLAILLAGVFKNTWGIASLMFLVVLFADVAAITLAFVARRRAWQHRGASSQAPLPT